MDPSVEQLDAEARAAAAAAAQAEVARAAAQAEADAREKAEKAAENAATLAGILKAIKDSSFPYFEDLLLPWEGYLYGIEFITLYHERAVSYLMETPQYQTEGGRTGELLYTKFSVYELGKTAVAALKMIQDQLLGIRDPDDENLYKYRREPWKDVRSGRVDYGRYMTRSLHLHNVLA